MTNLLTVPEAMAALRVSRYTLYNLIRTGDLESITIGRSRRIPVDAITAYVDGLRHRAVA